MSRLYRVSAGVGLLLWIALIFRVSAMSQLPGEVSPWAWFGDYLDEIGHFGEYAILGVLVYMAFIAGRYHLRSVLLGITICAAVLIGDEAFQPIIPNRTWEIKDLGIDALGAGASMTLMFWARRGQ